MKQRSRSGGKQIKGRRGNAALPRGRNSPKPIAHSTSPVAGDETGVARLSRELNEALEQLNFFDRADDAMQASVRGGEEGAGEHTEWHTALLAGAFW